MQRTVKVKVGIPVEDVLKTMSTVSAIFSLHVEKAKELGTYNKNKLHHALYYDIRAKYPEMNSAMIQSTRDCASEALKQSKMRKHPVKKGTSAIRYNSNTVSIRGNTVSLWLIGGRVKVEVVIPEYAKKTWEGHFQAATLLVKDGEVWLHATFKIPTPEKLPQGEVLGIDRGMIYAAVTSDGTFYSSWKVREIQRKNLFNKRSLQSKGTPSAKRHLKKLKGKEQRFRTDVNHRITKEIVVTGNTTFVLEDLRNIRKRMKGRRFNQRANGWNFHQFELFLQYKAEALGKEVVKVDARYTSQDCSVCGERGARKKHRFFCEKCGHKEHADLNAAKVIRSRHLSLFNK